MPKRYFRQSHRLDVGDRGIGITTLSYIFANLRHHWRTNLAAAAAVAIATAVLTGALLVGDSVRGSLRDLTLQRLGRIDHALQTPQLFRSALAAELASTAGFDNHFTSAQSALLLNGSATLRTESGTRRASNLDLIGVGEDFWTLGRDDPRLAAGLQGTASQGIWLTREVAADLQAKPGDNVLLRLPTRSDVPADSPLGEKADTVIGKRFTVAGVLPDSGLARFGLRPSQRPPRSIFVPLSQLADAIGEPDRANVLLVAGQSINLLMGEEAGKWLGENFRPRLEDYGIALKQHSIGNDFQYVLLSSDGLVLPQKVAESAAKAFVADGMQSVTTYLANSIRHAEQQIVYSTVAGVDSNRELGPLLNSDGDSIVLGGGEVALNAWAAERLQAKVGDSVELRYYQPESTHAQLQEAPPVSLTVTAIVELANEEGDVTRAADPNLSPQLEGVTDQASISDWDLPFELVEPITQDDEDYWDEYRTTPKAFVSQQLAAKLWGTRWGDVSLLRLPSSERQTVESYAARLRDTIEPADLGFAFMPVKKQGLAAASGTTPFDGLFLGFSMFLIASAIMLLVLLFRLAIESRASELGLLAAVGFSQGRAKQLLSKEVLCVAAVGGGVGVLLGIGYAWLMITGLKTLWVAAIAAPFLELHIGRWSLPIGFAVGVAVAYAATRSILRTVLTVPPTNLLRGNLSDWPDNASQKPRGRDLSKLTPVCLALGAVALGYWGIGRRGEAQAGAFFGAGACILTALLLSLRWYWHGRAMRRERATSLSLPQLAWSNLARLPGRSTLTVGLVAAASFLLLAISAFHLAPSKQGTGGYNLFGLSAVPIHFDLNSPEGRLELGFRDAEEEQLARATIDSIRVHGGEDASCLNLYRTVQPRILGVRDAQRVLADFGWSSKVGEGSAPPDLDAGVGSANGRPIVPVVLDFNTAMYSLHLSGSVGDRFEIRDGDEQPVTLEVVGLLKNSLLQGDLLVSDANFRKLFPQNSGSQLFLVRETERSASSDTSLEGILEERLSDYGFAATDATARLRSFLAVQNTYLSTFQSLGGLGLLLGTLGLAVVQLRSVVQRQGEIALLKAVGFRQRRVVGLVLLENLALLLLGLLIGGVAASIALVPQLGIQNTSLPWGTIASLLIIILVVGLAATWLATRSTLRRPIVSTLRGD